MTSDLIQGQGTAKKTVDANICMQQNICIHHLLATASSHVEPQPTLFPLFSSWQNGDNDNNSPSVITLSLNKLQTKGIISVSAVYTQEAAINTDLGGTFQTVFSWF